MQLNRATDKHEALYQDLIAAMRKHDLSAIEILAVTANMVGKVLAMQDQTKGDAALYMRIVAANIEKGNQQALAEILKPMGRE